MKHIIGFFKRYGWTIYLGGALAALTGICWVNWEFYVIIVPVVALFTWGRN